MQEEINKIYEQIYSLQGTREQLYNEFTELGGVNPNAPTEEFEEKKQQIKDLDEQIAELYEQIADLTDKMNQQMTDDMEMPMTKDAAASDGTSAPAGDGSPSSPEGANPNGGSADPNTLDSLIYAYQEYLKSEIPPSMYSDELVGLDFDVNEIPYNLDDYAKDKIMEMREALKALGFEFKAKEEEKASVEDLFEKYKEYLQSVLPENVYTDELAETEFYVHGIEFNLDDNEKDEIENFREQLKEAGYVFKPLEEVKEPYADLLGQYRAYLQSVLPENVYTDELAETEFYVHGIEFNLDDNEKDKIEEFREQLKAAGYEFKPIDNSLTEEETIEENTNSTPVNPIENMTDQEIADEIQELWRLGTTMEGLSEEDQSRYDALVAEQSRRAAANKEPWRDLFEKYKAYLKSVLPPMVYSDALAETEFYVHGIEYSLDDNEKDEIERMRAELKAAGFVFKPLENVQTAEAPQEPVVNTNREPWQDLFEQYKAYLRSVLPPMVYSDTLAETEFNVHGIEYNLDDNEKEEIERMRAELKAAGFKFRTEEITGPEPVITTPESPTPPTPPTPPTSPTSSEPTPPPVPPTTPAGSDGPDSPDGPDGPDEPAPEEEEAPLEETPETPTHEEDTPTVDDKKKKLWNKIKKGLGFTAGLASGIALSCVPGVGTISMAVAAVKLGTSAIGSAINVLTTKYPSGPIAKIYNRSSEFIAEKMPNVSSKVNAIRTKLKSSPINVFLNGMSIGFMSGNLYELFGPGTVLQTFTQQASYGPIVHDTGHLLNDVVIDNVGGMIR